jgi:hypothetical protein
LSAANNDGSGLMMEMGEVASIKHFIVNGGSQ